MSDVAETPQTRPPVRLTHVHPLLFGVWTPLLKFQRGDDPWRRTVTLTLWNLTQDFKDTVLNVAATGPLVQHCVRLVRVTTVCAYVAGGLLSPFVIQWLIPLEPFAEPIREHPNEAAVVF